MRERWNDQRHLVTKRIYRLQVVPSNTFFNPQPLSVDDSNLLIPRKNQSKIILMRSDKPKHMSISFFYIPLYISYFFKSRVMFRINFYLIHLLILQKLFFFKINFQIQSNGLLQRQLTGKNANYGSVEEPTSAVVTTTNPFISATNPFRSEPIQPGAQDTYMHGTIEDRAY